MPYLAKAGGVHWLRVILFTEIQIMDVHRVSRNTDAIGQLVVVVKPGKKGHRITGSKRGTGTCYSR